MFCIPGHYMKSDEFYTGKGATDSVNMALLFIHSKKIFIERVHLPGAGGIQW